MLAVFIGIGSNLGDRLANIKKAIDYLKGIEDIVIEAVSSIIETEPAQADGPSYLNGVIKIRTDLLPKELLAQLQNIEEILGRMRTYKNAPRIIDLDILLYAELVLDDPELTIPHPQMWERSFVMRPLLEIEPDIIETIKNLKFKMKNSSLLNF